MGIKIFRMTKVPGKPECAKKRHPPDSKVVGKMTDKDACEIVSVKGDWAKITSGKVEGYVKTEYLLTGDAAKNVAKKFYKSCYSKYHNPSCKRKGF